MFSYNQFPSWTWSYFSLVAKLHFKSSHVTTMMRNWLHSSANSMSIRLGSGDSLVESEFDVHFFRTEVVVILLLLLMWLNMFLAVAAAVAKPSKATSNCRNDYYYSQNNKH